MTEVDELVERREHGPELPPGMKILRDVVETMRRWEDAKTRLVVAPVAYDAMVAAVESHPLLRGQVKVVASSLLTDASQVYVVPPPSEKIELPPYSWLYDDTSDETWSRGFAYERLIPQVTTPISRLVTGV